MATTNGNPTPKQNPTPGQQTSGTNNSKQRLIAIAAVVVVALLLVNAFLLYNKFSQDKQIAQQATELQETENLKAELEKQYYEALSELEDMRTNNDELNTLIDSQEAELKEQKARIEALIGKERDLGRARVELRNLKAQLNQYVAEVEALKEQNEMLAQENTELQETKTVLESDLEQQREMTEELSEAKAELVSSKEELESRNKKLARTVDMASTVKVSNVDITGIMIKDNGKTRKRRNAEKVDQLKVCFETTINAITNPGTEEFYIRIISPAGETLAVEELGSGIMTNAATNEQVRYTAIKEAEYNNDEQTLCLIWESNNQFPEGSYGVEIYNKGFLAGTGSFTLR